MTRSGARGRSRRGADLEEGRRSRGPCPRASSRCASPTRRRIRKRKPLETPPRSSRRSCAKQTPRRKPGTSRRGRPSSRSAASSPSGRLLGLLVLAITQIALWAACRSDDVLGDAFVDRFDVWSQAPGGSFGLATCALLFTWAAADVRASATPWFGRVAGALEATAADGAAGALGPKAPRAWRASDLKWRSVAQALEFAASGPRVAALHGGLQVALVETARSLQPAPIDATGEGLAAVSGVALVALFAFAAETLRTSNDDEVLRAENAAVRASLKSEDGSEALHRTICLAWLDAFPDPESGRALPPLGAAVRAAAAGLGLRPHERRPPRSYIIARRRGGALVGRRAAQPGPRRRPGPGPGGGHGRVVRRSPLFIIQPPFKVALPTVASRSKSILCVAAFITSGRARASKRLQGSCSTAQNFDLCAAHASPSKAPRHRNLSYVVGIPYHIPKTLACSVRPSSL